MTSSMPSITKKQAERILETEMMERDFWFVSEGNDNSKILQDVLDIIYNGEAGNQYTAKYSQGQNHTRLCIYCMVCRKDLMSYIPFIAHDSGKPHKKALQLIHSKKEMELQMTEKLQFRDPLIPSGQFEQDTLEDQLDQCGAPIVGLHYVYRERTKGQECFTCQLCIADKNTKMMSQEDAYRHLTSDFHTFKYMNVAYKYNGSSADSFGWRKLLREIVEREGKVNTCFPVLGDPEVEQRRRRQASRGPDRRPGPSRSPPQEPPDAKRPKPCPRTSEAATQTLFESEGIGHFMEQLRNCIEEESAVGGLLRGLPAAERSVVADVVKVLANGTVAFSSSLHSRPFQEIARKFFEMVSSL